MRARRAAALGLATVIVRDELTPERLAEAVRAELEPTYGSWANFEEWLPLNIEGLLAIWASGAGTPAA